MKNFDYDHQDTRNCKSMDLGKKLQKKKQLFFAFLRSNNSLFEMAKPFFLFSQFRHCNLEGEIFCAEFIHLSLSTYLHRILYLYRSVT